MAAGSQRGSSSRGRSSSGGSSGSSRGSSGGSSRGRSTASKAKSAPSKAASGASSSKASAAKEKVTDAAKSAGNNGGTDKSAAQTITQVAIPAVTGALGVAGGVLLGRTALKRNRKVLGIPVPGVKIDMADMSKQIGEAGKQLSRLANEVKTARERAEKIGKAIT
jgi:hypothetical protein